MAATDVISALCAMKQMQAMAGKGQRASEKGGKYDKERNDQRRIQIYRVACGYL